MNRLTIGFAGLIPLSLLLPTSAPGAPARPAPGTVTVPVVVCPTTVGLPMAPAPVPASTQVSAPTAHFAVYSTVSAGIQVLGPAGLDCQGNLAVNGSTSITVWPQAARSETIANGGVSAAVYPACTGCMISFACQFFPSARKQLPPGAPACPAPPLGQVVHRVNPYTVVFSGPPHRHVPMAPLGLVPSNSADPTSGLVIFGSYRYKNYWPDVALGAACVLPASKQAICNAILDDFRASELRRLPRLRGA